MADKEESLIAIPKVNPLTINTYISDSGALGAAIEYEIQDMSVGQKGYIEIPFDFDIESVTLLADVSGDTVIDIWVDDFASFPPTVADSICAAAKPYLTSEQASRDSTLTGWTKHLTAGQIMTFNVDSATTVSKVTVSLKGVKS